MSDKLISFYNDNSLIVNISLGVILLVAAVVYIIFRKKINEIYKKYKEIINYIIVGVLTTLVSIGSYWLFRFIIKNYVILSIISWILAVSFAYITNRIYVFESKSTKIVEEITKFFGARLFTLGLEVTLMILFVSVFKINDMVSKIILQVVVLVLNYIFSKIFVFKKDKKTTE
ncbi:MAG TPA: GtrA family protein [Bacilli bacterium]|nr:GtrA family protein [Bacilli bacterium]